MPPNNYWYPLACPTIGEEEIEAATQVFRSGQTTMGEKVEEFEEAFARRVGARHAVMVNSGSSADLLIAFALNLDGEVILPAVTWPTHLWSWKLAGSSPVLADVGDLNVTVETIGDRLGKHTRGLSVTHLMGVPAEMDKIAGFARTNDLVLTEDCCEALGSSTYGDRQVGSFGVAAAWSFFFSHHMTTMEGGMVTTNHQTIATRCRTLRSHGWARHLPPRLDGLDPRYTFVDQGFNLRPTEVQAAIGLVQLTKLDGFNDIRRQNWGAFVMAVDGNPLINLPIVPNGASPSWFGIPMIVANGQRDALAAYLEATGVETRPILAGNLVRQPAFWQWKGHFPGADRIHTQGLYIGLHPVPREMAAVARIINGFAEARAA